MSSIQVQPDNGQIKSTLQPSPQAAVSEKQILAGKKFRTQADKPKAKVKHKKVRQQNDNAEAGIVSDGVLHFPIEASPDAYQQRKKSKQSKHMSQQLNR